MDERLRRPLHRRSGPVHDVSLPVDDALHDEAHGCYSAARHGLGQPAGRRQARRRSGCRDLSRTRGERLTSTAQFHRTRGQA